MFAGGGRREDTCMGSRKLGKEKKYKKKQLRELFRKRRRKVNG